MKVKNLLYGIILLVAVIGSAGCGKDDDKPEVSFQYEEDMDRFHIWNTTRSFESDVTLSWTSDADLVFEKGEGKKYYFMLPDRELNGANVTLTLTSPKSTTSVTRNLPVTRLAEHRRYGLGFTCTEAVSHSVDYEFFVDQNTTGEYSAVNCGPAVIEMVCKWADRSFSRTTHQIREDLGFMVMDGFYSHHMEYLIGTHYGFDSYTVNFNKMEDVLEQIDAGYAVILLVDIFYVRTESPSSMDDWRKDKHYTTGSKDSGHYLFLKGYKKVDGEYLMEVCDPASGAKYIDGQYKGKDRYYRMSDLLTASKQRWEYAIVVKPRDRPAVPAGIGVRSVSDPESKAVDFTKVPDARGDVLK